MTRRMSFLPEDRSGSSANMDGRVRTATISEDTGASSLLLESRGASAAFTRPDEVRSVWEDTKRVSSEAPCCGASEAWLVSVKFAGRLNMPIFERPVVSAGNRANNYDPVASFPLASLRQSVGCGVKVWLLRRRCVAGAWPGALVCFATHTQCLGVNVSAPESCPTWRDTTPEQRPRLIICGFPFPTLSARPLSRMLNRRVRPGV